MCYAAKSNVRLESVREALSEAFDLPPFVFDCHDTWRYAWVEDRDLWLNVTKANDCRTVETWMQGCPTGVNYRVILTAEDEPSDFMMQLSEAMRYAANSSADA